MSKTYNNRLTFATLPRTERGKPLVLGADPKGKTFLYTNGNSVIIRDLAKPEIADVYTEHSCPVLVAKYSPSGFYISSADKSGKLRIWDTVNTEHILKNEYQPISGPIYDIAWSADSQVGYIDKILGIFQTISKLHITLLLTWIKCILNFRESSVLVKAERNSDM